MSSKSAPTPAPGQLTTISLNDIAERYLGVYQRLFDVVSINLAGFRKINEEDYDQIGQQASVMPKVQARMDFEAAKDAAQFWIGRNALSEALSTVVPLMEDCRTVCALCDYKIAGKTDASAIQKITGEDRQKFLQLPIPEKFKAVAKSYGITSELEPHVLSLMDLAKAMVLKDGKVTEEEAKNGELVLQIRAITVTQQPTQSASGETILGLARRMSDHSRTLKVGDKAELNRAELLGALVTIAGFLATFLKGVQDYAQKVGAADDKK